MKIKYTLPLPPSVNVAYNKMGGSGTRMYKSDKYRDWLKHAEVSALTQERYEITGNKFLWVEYKYYMPLYYKNGNIKKVDVFNYEKCLSDFLNKIIPGFDDSKIKKGIVEKINSDRMEVEVEVYEY